MANSDQSPSSSYLRPPSPPRLPPARFRRPPCPLLRPRPARAQRRGNVRGDVHGQPSLAGPCDQRYHQPCTPASCPAWERLMAHHQAIRPRRRLFPRRRRGRQRARARLSVPHCPPQRPTLLCHTQLPRYSTPLVRPLWSPSTVPPSDFCPPAGRRTPHACHPPQSHPDTWPLQVSPPSSPAFEPCPPRRRRRHASCRPRCPSTRNPR